MDTYTTVLGDTWDTIAKKAYGDEYRADDLLKARANIRLIDYQVFPAGVTVYLPEISDDDAANDDLPDWRKD